MHLHDGAVERDRFDLDAHDLSMLQLLEHAIHHAQLGPPVHPGVDRVPIAEALGQATPLAAVLCNVQDRIQDLQVGKADIASLPRKTALDLLVLGLCDFHAQIVGEK
jgi:hypothetical protein